MISKLFDEHGDILNKMVEKVQSEMRAFDKLKLEMNIEKFQNYLKQKATKKELSNSLTFLMELISQWYEEEIIITIDEIDY